MKSIHSKHRWLALAGWLIGVVICATIIIRTSFTADLSAFLPQSPTKEQQVLLDQLRDGVVSRLILIGIEGTDAPARATLSKEVARQLRENAAFVTVNNGEPVNTERDQAYLFNNRYLLSDAVTPERFTVAGLQEAIGNTINLLASPAGMLIKPLLPRDPTGETIELASQMAAGGRPQMSHGVWVSRDGERAVLLVQTRAAGADTDGQQQAMQHIQQAFNAATQQHGTEAAKLIMTGPGVFSVASRETIKSEVERLAIISTCLIIMLLLLVYRSFTALALGLLPVLSGALVGIVVVSLGFGVVHGLTLGFGTTLIGEAVDYSIYLFVQSRQARAEQNGTSSGNWVAAFWPTIQLGVLTSIVGFSSLLLSSFPGLAQLGLYSIAGLVAAALVTRFVLPYLLPENFRIRDVSAMGNRLAKIAHWMPALRLPLVILTMAACIVLLQYRTALWNADLSSLSPVSQEDQAMDERLRADMGAPDARYMIVVPGADQQAALRSAERVSAQLQTLVEQNVLTGFESPSRYLPSIATQQARQNSLPTAELEQRLKQAAADLPIRAEIFQPFLADVAAAKARPPIQRADLDNTSLALAVDSLLFERGDQWNALLPVTIPTENGAADAAVDAIQAALRASDEPNALFVDLKTETSNLYANYFREAVILSLGGLAGIVVLLLLFLRSPLQVARILLPLAASVICVVALLMLSGQRLTILHLIGLLLIVAVGSNYALFFNTRNSVDTSQGISPQTLTSLVFANLTTVAGFGILGFSSVPVLQAIGTTVGPGAVLALVFAASFAARQPAFATGR